MRERSNTYEATYLLPLRASDSSMAAELAAYINGIPCRDVVVVDASAPELFALHARLFADHVRHIAPASKAGSLNGKAHGVVTGLRLAQYEYVIIADDDVRYDAASLSAVLTALGTADVIRPQNYFEPCPWHAVLDGARTLINRSLDGDWPGTLAVRKSALPRGYNTAVLFENYELIRTICARGGRERVARNIFIRRLPPTCAHYWSQRIRQAYDEFARPPRLILALGIAPLCAWSAIRHRFEVINAIMLGATALAGAGWLRAGAYKFITPLAVFAAPVWLAERSVCAWLALYERARFGGVRYAGSILPAAASTRAQRTKWAA
ncbi:MAG TPA: glycosyltransferase family 2 protein [Candidatus Baltobacteraceae bacterium]|jgi:hypothetical protein|nr:glycosyltransferase family 2 protein [Candidatus Baltobacteraceae bacterium]